MVLLLVLLAFAATAERTSPWVTPPSSGEAPATQDTVAPDNGTSSGGGSGTDEPATTSLSVIGVAITVFAGTFVLFGVWTIVRGLVMWVGPRFRIHRRRGLPDIDPLDDDPLGIVPPMLETDTAKLVLHEGEPRNAIVACWMQLEAEAAWAGIPRLEHETSTEYVQRVVSTASVDAGPIGELAQLFREARFSDHEIDETHRVQAIAALERVERALLRRVGTIT